jgi:hypothetical protein
MGNAIRIGKSLSDIKHTRTSITGFPDYEWLLVDPYAMK